MRILKLHHPTGHPFRNKDEYQVELPDGKMINPYMLEQCKFGAYKLYWNNQGIWVQICSCGQGTGKAELDYIKPILIVPESDYDFIDFVGEPLIISQELRQNFSEGLNLNI